MHQSTIPDIGVRDLLAILTVAQSGSFIAASLTLHMSQPALTRTVQRVEDAVGVPLFRRTTRRVEITPPGREFVAVAERVLNDLRIASRNLREVSDELRGQVIVSSVMSVAQTTLPAIVAGYRKSRPAVEIHVREGVHGAVIEDIRGGIADLGVTYMGDLPEGFVAEAIGTEAFFAILPPNHSLRRKRSLSLPDFAQQPLVSFPAGSRTRRLIEGSATSIGVLLDHSVTVTQFATLVSFVAAGVGLSIVPGGVLPTARAAGLEVRPIVSPEISREMGIVRLADRELTPVVAAFLTLLRADLGKAMR
jgi:DNA-binding transcriptional LysR family regulator